MWIVIFLGGALLTGYALYRQAVRESGSRFQCRHCGHTFRTEWKNLFLATHSWGEYKLKCPNCGAADYCANLDKKKKNKKEGDYRDVDSIGYGKCYSDLCAAAQSDCDGNRHGCIEGRGKASDCSADGGRCGSQHHDGK